MVERTVIQWDKDDLDAVGLLKVDVLALGMLSALRRCFDLLAAYRGQRWTLASLPREDAATYAMISKADTVGVFQIESRAQMAMLPRLRPQTFYDLVIQVAIVRPGPIQGDMVHPYLRRRNGEEKVEYPSKELIPVFERTLGCRCSRSRSWSWRWWRRNTPPGKRTSCAGPWPPGSVMVGWSRTASG